MKEKSFKGYFLVFAGVALFATVEVAVKDAHAQGCIVPSFFFVALRFFISGLIFILISLFNRNAPFRLPEKRDLLKIFLLGIVAAPLAIGLFHIALSIKGLKASSGAAIFSVNPIFVAVLAPLILKENTTLKEWIGLILGFGGAFLMSYSKGSGTEGDGSLAGGLVMILSAVFFSLNAVMAKPMIRKYGGIVFNGWAFVFGGITAFIISLIFERSFPASLLEMSRGSLDIYWVIIPGTTVAYYCYLVGLSKVSITKGAYFFFIKPFLALIFSLIYLTEALFSVTEWMGFLLILSGLSFILFIPDLGKRKKNANIETPAATDT